MAQLKLTLLCLHPPPSSMTSNNMSTNNSTGGQRPRREKANLHPGQIILDSQIKRRTTAEKQADDLCAQATKDARAAAIQQGCARVSEMEATIEAKQVVQRAVKAKPVRPAKWGGSQKRPTHISTAPRAEGEDVLLIDMKSMDSSINELQLIWKSILTVQPSVLL